MSKENELQRYIIYLETDLIMKAERIAELEAVLLYVLNLRDHKHDSDIVYVRATAILHNEFSRSVSTVKKYKKLINGN